MLVLVPQGRGNWAAVTMRIDGRHVTPLSVRVGQLLTLGAVVFRVCQVLP